MKTEYIVFLVLAAAMLGGYAYAAYDSYKSRKCKQSKLVVLRLNNSYVRKLLTDKGFNLCDCAFYNTNRYLFTTEGDRICGFTEDCVHLIEDAEKNNQEVIDCDIIINRFVYEIQKLQMEYGTKGEK